MVAVTSFTEDGESQGGSEESSVGTQGALPYPWLQGQVTWEGALPITGLSLLPSLLQGTHLGLGTLSNLVPPAYWLSFYTQSFWPFSAFWVQGQGRVGPFVPRF